MAVPAAAKLRRSAFPLLAAIALGCAGWSTVQAAEPLSFVVPASDSDGYGISDCMQAGNACGQVMANALCEAHGHVKATAFGSTDDVTGSIAGNNPLIHHVAGDIMIRCTD